MKLFKNFLILTLLITSYSAHSLNNDVVNNSQQLKLELYDDCDEIALIKYDDAIEAGLNASLAVQIWAMWINECALDDNNRRSEQTIELKG
jgi:hypothetical protein